MGLIAFLCAQKDEAKLTCHNLIVCALKTLGPSWEGLQLEHQYQLTSLDTIIITGQIANDGHKFA